MRKGFRRKLYGLPIIAGMALAMIGMNMGVVFAEEEEKEPEEHVCGFIPVEKELDEVSPAGKSVPALKEGESYPERYRSDEQPWGKGIRIKDQKKSGLCWAFATTTACEFSYAKEMYETTGEVVPVEELSPGHLGQFFFYRVVDPLGNTEGDMNYMDPSYSWATIGGNGMYGMQHLAGWSGLASEETAPIQKIYDYIDANTSDRMLIPPYSSDLAYKNALVLQESILYREANADLLKKLVTRYGAVSIAIKHSNKYMNLDEIDPETGEPYDSGRSFYNYESSSGLNHAVTVIGWDDAYPKENFRHEVTDYSVEEGKKTVMPEKDGAFVVQNSWGDEANEHGIFYMSYESRELKNNSNYILAFDMQPVDAYKYNFYYDGTAGIADASDRDDDGSYRDYYTMPGTFAANVFTNTTGNPIEVGAVGYTTFSSGLSYYDVSVYTNLTDPTDPESGVCAGTTRISSTTAGCKSGELDFKAVVAPGEKYSVIFRFADFSAFGTELTRTGGSFDYQTHIEPGQSFFRSASSSQWKDMADYEACFRIKAFANDYEDKKAPEIDGTALKVTPGQEGTVCAGGKVSASVKVKDDVAVDSVSIEFETEKAEERRVVELAASEADQELAAGEAAKGLAAGEAAQGLWEGTFDVTDKTSPGAWHVKRITAKDAAGNEAVLYNSKVSGETPNADLSAGDFNVGKIPVGWQQQDDGKRYYCAEDGTRVTGWLKYDKKWYYLDETTGVMKTGWLTDKNSRYFLDADGTMVTGWKKIGKDWYFFGTDGAMATGWKKVGKKWYYLEDSGAMATGWKKDGKIWYYLGSDGAMATGWKKVGKDWYFLKANGAMAANEWIRGYRLKASGAWSKEPKASWRKNKTGWWYGDTAGWYAKKQWMRIDGKLYYFDASGYMVTGIRVIDGTVYSFDDDGACEL